MQFSGKTGQELPVPVSSCCFARLIGDLNNFNATIRFPATMMNHEIMRGTARRKRTRK